MNLEYVPLLEIQRELQTLPRDMARFERYLRTISPDGENLKFPPLSLVNPMGKEHVTEILESLLAQNAEEIAAAATAKAAMNDTPGDFRIALVVIDDLSGGWTNRYDFEFNLRFGSWVPTFESSTESERKVHLPRWLDCFWLTGVLWSSEPMSLQTVREAAALPVLRAEYVYRHGSAQTLRDMLAQEGQIAVAAGCSGPVLTDEDLAYTREVLTPFLDCPVQDKKTCIECLFGDEAGRTLGFTPRGLSLWAGLALAIHDAASSSSPSSSYR